MHFWDDNLTLKRSHIVGICREIIARGLNHMAFCTPNGVRVDTLDEGLLLLMKRAGFYKLTFAVESGSRRILSENGKNTKLTTILRNTVLAKKIGFLLNSYFMMGFPGETEESIEKTIKIAKSFPLNYATFFLLKPLPGSKIFKEWAGDRDFLHFDWNNLSSYMQKNNFLLSELSPDYLSKAHKRAHREVILQVKMLASIIWISLKSFHFSQFKFNLERLVHLIFGYNSSIFT
ncbi:radical SAM protein [Candidatus Bathyarchaeota archaeon]|nr:radical SAM protein [Candidatus Bathyarchaeota archaeon]